MMAAGLGVFPRLSEKVLGQQEASLRELLRRFREGDIENALRRAVPIDAELRRGSGMSGGSRLPIHDIEASILALLTMEPARYGFHATLKAPFRLRGASEQDLLTAFDAFAERHRTVPVGPLEVACIGGFVVLRPAQPSAELEELAAACVVDFDVFRAPLSQSERERRLSGGLNARQLASMQRWAIRTCSKSFVVT